MKSYRLNLDRKMTDGMFDTTPSYNGELLDFTTKWNEHIWLPKIKGTDRQLKLIKAAMQRQYFKEHWRESFGIIAKSPFLLKYIGKWFNLEWYLEPDNFDKILEEKYVDDRYKDKLP